MNRLITTEVQLKDQIKSVDAYDCRSCGFPFAIIKRVDAWGVELLTGGIVLAGSPVCDQCEMQAVEEAIERDDVAALAEVGYYAPPMTSEPDRWPLDRPEALRLGDDWMDNL